MGIVNKSENWWLRLSLVLFALIALGSASVMNRSVTTDRQILIDSLNYYKLQNDTLRNSVDSLYEENFELNHWNGIQELILDELEHTPKYKGLEKDIEKERNSNKYE
jgi:cell shape-determining protein MreC